MFWHGGAILSKSQIQRSTSSNIFNYPNTWNYVVVFLALQHIVVVFSQPGSGL